MLSNVSNDENSLLLFQDLINFLPFEYFKLLLKQYSKAWIKH